jgi:hypothetical protein
VAVVLGVTVVSVLGVFADVVLLAVVELPAVVLLAAVELPVVVCLDKLPVFAVWLVEVPVLLFWAFIDKTPINANPKISALFLKILAIFINFIIIILPFYSFNLIVLKIRNAETNAFKVIKDLREKVYF